MDAMTKEQMANAIGTLRGFAAWAERVSAAPQSDASLALRRIAEEARLALNKTAT
jgi:hypothetical protein